MSGASHICIPRMKAPLSTFAKAYNDLTSAIVRAKRACRSSAQAEREWGKSILKMQRTNFKKTSQGRAGRPKGSRDKRPRCKRHTSKLISSHHDASDHEDSTDRSSESSGLDKCTVMLRSTIPDSDLMHAIHVCPRDTASNP